MACAWVSVVVVIVLYVIHIDRNITRRSFRSSREFAMVLCIVWVFRGVLIDDGVWELYEVIITVEDKPYKVGVNAYLWLTSAIV